MTKEAIAAALNRLAIRYEEIQDPQATFNFAVSLEGRGPAHITAVASEAGRVAVLAGTRIADTDWERLCALGASVQRKTFVRIRQLLILKGLRGSFTKEAETDVSPRRLLVINVLGSRPLTDDEVYFGIMDALDGQTLFMTSVEEAIA